MERRRRMWSLALTASLVLMVTPGVTAGAAAPDPKVTICHRTNSIDNPYVAITVSQDAVDGDLANDKGRGDHYMEHLGPIFDPVINIRNGGDWGDIIPAIPGVHAGRNATDQGAAILGNGCHWVPVPNPDPGPDTNQDT